MYPISGQVSSCIQVCLAAGLALLCQLKVLGALSAQWETVKDVCFRNQNQVVYRLNDLVQSNILHVIKCS